jgi:hypothetical protein
VVSLQSSEAGREEGEMLKITMNRPDDTTKVSLIPKKTFQAPANWLFQSSYRGTDHYVTSDGVCVYVEEVKA